MKLEVWAVRMIQWLIAWCRNTLIKCPVCGGWMDMKRPGGRVLIEAWGPWGITLGSQISKGTCHRVTCSGTWYDEDYIEHPLGDAKQVNSKAILDPRRAKPVQIPLEEAQRRLRTKFLCGCEERWDTSPPSGILCESHLRRGCRVYTPPPVGFHHLRQRVESEA